MSKGHIYKCKYCGKYSKCNGCNNTPTKCTCDDCFSIYSNAKSSDNCLSVSVKEKELVAYLL